MQTDIPIQPGLFRVIRILRIGRLLRFFESARGIRQLIFTIMKSAPALSNVGTLLFLVIFIYAILGMNMFGYVKFSQHIDQSVNFRTFMSSFCVLFRVATAAGWNNVMEGVMIEPPFCDPNKQFSNGGSGITQGDCGNKPVAIVYFVSYMFLIVQFVVNMYIAVIMENFNNAQNQESVGVTEDAIEDFYETWKEYDPKAKQFIDYRYLSDFLDEVSRPFNVPKPNIDFISRVCCPVREGNRIHCMDLMQVLIKNIIGEDKCSIDEADKELARLMEKVERKMKKKFPGRDKNEVITTSKERSEIEDIASRRIQKLTRWYLLKSHIETLDEQQNNKAYKMRRIEDTFMSLYKMQQTEKERVRQAEEVEKQRLKDMYDDEDDDYEGSHKSMMETPLL